MTIDRSYNPALRHLWWQVNYIASYSWTLSKFLQTRSQLVLQPRFKHISTLYIPETRTHYFSDSESVIFTKIVLEVKWAILRHWNSLHNISSYSVSYKDLWNHCLYSGVRFWCWLFGISSPIKSVGEIGWN